MGSARGSYPNGLLERLWVIGLGLLAIVVIHFTPFAGLRGAAGAGSASLAVATAVPTAAPATAAPAPTAVPTAVEAAAPAADPARPAPADPPNYRVVADGDGANLRGAPNRSAEVVTSVRDGTVLTNRDEQQTADGLVWRKVADGNLEGWVAAELLTPAP